MKHVKNTLLVLSFSLIFGSFLNAQNTYKLTVSFKNIENNEGKIWAAVYNSSDSWMKKEVQGKSGAISNKNSVIIFELPAGTYALSAFHDENNNKELDTNGLGIPKEDYGFSNNPNAMFGPPAYKKSTFTLDKDLTITVEL